MRFRNWIIIEVVTGIILGITGGLIKNELMLGLGAGSTMMPLFHNLFLYMYNESKLDKELKRDKQYMRGILCTNCDEYNWFRTPIGVCIPDFLLGRHCKYCQCELKLKEASLT